MHGFNVVPRSVVLDELQESFCRYTIYFTNRIMGFRIMVRVCEGVGGGGVKYSRRASVSQLFLCFLMTFFSPVTDHLLLVIKWNRKNNPQKSVRHASVNLRSACK